LSHYRTCLVVRELSTDININTAEHLSQKFIHKFISYSQVYLRTLGFLDVQSK